MMELRYYREQIDRIDDELLRLFLERMGVSRQIAQYKKEHGLPAMDALREGEKLAGIDEKAGKEMRSYARLLYSTLFELSRSYQESILGAESELNKIKGVCSADVRKPVF
jgi:chorismate mutase/prephenate dehydratase